MLSRSLTCLCFAPLLFGACSGGENGSQQVTEARQDLVIATTSQCTVELTKIDYNQPGADTGDFIELHVTKTGSGVTSLLDCGVSAIALYDSNSCVLPYALVAVSGVVIPSDGYIEIAPGTSGITIDLTSVGSAGWIHNGAGELGILSLLPLQTPIAWAAYGGAAQCVPALLNLSVAQIQTENDSAPNLTNVSCDSTFHLVDATLAAPRTVADCGTGGGSGGGGASGSGGVGGLGIGGLGIGGLGIGGLGVGGLGVGGSGVGVGGSGVGGSGVGGSGVGGSGVGGSGLGGSGVGGSGVGGSGVGGSGLGGSGVGGSGGSGVGGSGLGGSSSGASGGESGTIEEGGAGDTGGTSNNTAGEGGTEAMTAGTGGGISHAGESSNAGTAAHAMVVEGGGCSCSLPTHRSGTDSRAWALLLAFVGLTLRRRAR